ncbi:MAG: pyruvate ferredoxin oxidoreductase, partial [Dehalococcoidia bacterium]|nr:pyruvate ferredoxin oxidoreductase [Dehalococcoidia bacterium]
ARSIDYARLAVLTGLYPLFEIEDGRVKAQRIPGKMPVTAYLKDQTRFRHLFGKGGNAEGVEQIQKVADYNIDKYGLLG